MMKKIIKIKQLVQVALSVSILALFSSCQQEFQRLIPERDYGLDTVDVAFGTPKVLYLIVDGARGESVRTANATNINALLPESIYSWVSLSDETVTSPGTNWTDMLTGVKKNKHGVVGNDFSENDLETYPLIYERVKEAQPESDIRVFTPSTIFENNLTAGVDVSEVVANDAAVKD